VTDPAGLGDSPPWYLPAARNNVIGMLSAGLVMPARGLMKYYPDLLSLAPGRIILTSSGARREWFDVGEESRHDIPALVQVHVQPVGEQIEYEGSLLVAVAGVIPASRIAAVHFPSDRDADEFLARRYDNFNPDDVRINVAPDLFHDDALPGRAEIRTWLSSLGEAPRPTTRDITAADSLGGALLMLSSCPGLSPDELRVRKVLLERLLFASAETSVEEVVWNALAVPEWLSADAEPDAVLLAATLTVLGRLAPTTRLGSRRVLADISEEVRSRSSEEAIGANLARVQSVLKAETELRPLTRRAGLRSAKSLLLFLLRPSPQDVLTWAQEMLGDPFAVLGAAVLSGFTSGARALPTEFRQREVSEAVANLQADRINASSGRPVGSFLAAGSSAPEIRTTEDDGRTITSLYLGGVELAAASEQAGKPTSAQPELSGPEPDLTMPPAASGADVAELVRLVESADLTNPDIARSCAAVCSRLGWTEIVETTVRTDESGFRVKGSEIIPPGTLDIGRSIDAAAFIERITELSSISAADLKALKAALQGRTRGKRAPAKR